MIELTWAGNKMTKSCMVVIWLPIVGHMVNSNQKKELVFGLQPGRERKKERGREREGSHVEDTSFSVTFIILQQPLEKRQPWGCVEHTELMTTTGENKKRRASNVQGETRAFFFFPLNLFLSPSPISHLLCHTRLLSSLNSLEWNYVYNTDLNKKWVV